jgi:hypothetical protein
VSLAVATFKAVPIADPGETAMLPAGRDLAVAAAPDANPIGTLRLARPLRVEVIERRGHHARFVLQRPTDVIVAWVSDAALLPATPSLGIEAVEPLSPTASHMEWVFVRSTVRCPRELPVATEQAGERQPVGSIRAGAFVDLGHERGGWVEILVHSAAVMLTLGTRLVTAKADLRECEVRVPSHPRMRRSTTWGFG